MHVAVVGAGYWGPNLIRNVQLDARCERLTVCDVRPAILEKMRGKSLGIETTTRLSDVLEDDSVDAVVIATPAATHAALGRQALEAGKDVMIEKPLALSVSDAIDLAQLADARQRVLMVGHTFEYNAAVRKIKAYIDEGRVGDIFYVYSQRLNLGQLRSDVNAFWNLAPHDVSIILFWLGQVPTRVVAHGRAFLQNGTEDVVFATLYFPSGIVANIHVSWLDPNKVRRVTVVGSRSMIVYDDVTVDAPIQVFDKGFDRVMLPKLEEHDSLGEFMWQIRTGDLTIPRVAYQEPLKVEMEHFLDCVQSRARPLTDGWNGVRVVQVLEAVSTSLRQGTPAEVPDPELAGAAAS